MSKLLKKFNAGQKRTFDVKFMPATSLELKELGDDKPDGFIAGWASTSDLDVYQHRVMGGAFAESIKKRGLTGPKGIKLLLGHNWDQVAGVITKLEYRGDRLWIEAQLNLNISYARDGYEAAKMNGGLSFSVGFILQEYSVQGNEKDGEWLRIDKGDLYEVSAVPFPANDSAGMLVVKDGSENDLTTIAEFEKHLIASGLVKNRNDARSITQVVKKSASLFLKAQTDPVLVEPVTPAQPLLAADTLKSLTDHMAKMKALLAR